VGDRTRLILVLILVLIAISTANGAELSKEVPASDVLAKIVAGEPAEFDNCVIVGDLNLGGLTIERPIHFNYTVFQDSVNFNYTTFGCTAFFRSSEFNGDAYFRHSAFRDVDFWNTAFNRYALFEYSVFYDDASFRYSVFKGHAGFAYCEFNRDADFVGSKFYCNTSSRVGNGNFYMSVFNGYASFSASVFDSAAIFNNCRFNNVADIRNSYFSYADFSSTIFNVTAGFNESEFSKVVKFNDVQFRGLTLLNNIKFKEDVFFDNATFDHGLDLTRTSYNKLYIRLYNIKGGLIFDDSAYLSLIKNFKDLGYFEDADNCYFQYRKDRRNQPWPCVYPLEESARKFIDFLSEWSYGYGTRPVNPFIESLLLIGLFGLVWRRLGLGKDRKGEKKDFILDMDTLSEIVAPKKTDNNSNWSKLQSILIGLEPFSFSAAVFLSGAQFLIDPPELPKIPNRSKHLVKHIFDLERILGIIFIALFMLAIGRTVIRAA
jgi:hypothetical protein